MIQVVAAVIVNEQNQILCCKRSQKKGGGWEFPGGKIEAGETPEQALVREIKEELNLDIKVKEFITETTYQDRINLKTYIAKIIGGKLIMTEHRALCWCNVETAMGLNFLEADRPTLEILSERYGG